MAGGYDTTPVEPLDRLMGELTDLKTRVAELERPTGTQIAEIVSNAISPLAVHADAGPITVTPTNATIVTATVNVPVGYTRAMVVAISSMSVWNDSAINILLTSWVDINGVVLGRNVTGSMASGFPTTVTAAASSVLTGLGSSFLVKSIARTAAGPSLSYASNAINLDVSVLFLR